MDAITVENLQKTYGNQVRALKGVSFRVPRGYIFGLLGPNGAGKSTTTRILVTLTRPSGGQAAVAGHDVVKEAGAVRKKIGYVAQDSGVDKYTTGKENLVLQARLQRVPGKEVTGRVSRLLEWVGLAEAADKLVSTYSGGMKRRLDIAMGLVHNPEILFLDEPTTGLDPESRSLLWQDLNQLRKEQNITILLTTHYLEEADQMCDHLAIVDQGEVVVDGAPHELKSKIQGDTVTMELRQQAKEAAVWLRSVPGVLEAVADNRTLAVRVSSQGGEAIPFLLKALEKNGVGVQSVSLSRPSLDDVYLFHTGRRFTAGKKNHPAPAAPKAKPWGGEQ